MAQKKRVVRTGLDIGKFSIKYARIALEKDGSRKLLNFGVHLLAGTSRKNLSEELAAIAARLPEKGVNVSLSGPSVVVRYIMLPVMKEEELSSSMQFEAEKYIPFNINEVVLDHQILEKDVAGKMRVLLVAAKKEAINELIELLQQAGLSTTVIDIDSFALINAFSHNNPPGSGQDRVRALLNIGESLSSIDILHRGLSFFSRDFLIAGGDITKAISQKLNVDYKTAQGLKHNPEGKSDEIAEITKAVLVTMLDEIRLSLSYYENQSGRGVDEIYLSGGALAQAGLAQYFSDSLGIKCRLWDPTKVFSIAQDISTEELGKVKHELPVAIGLALRA